MHEANDTLYRRICDKIDSELAGAEDKDKRPDYWHRVGYLEQAAARDASEAIAAISRNLSTADYEQKVRDTLYRLVQTWRANDEDEDGYGVGTIHAIGSEVPNYDPPAPIDRYGH